ncbi:MAG: branched-chain amino acid transaminase [Patescibacteria group bacterium]|nr:branched-chain amino acid transaminase [Patescibacteria group bacterium]
MKKTKAIFLDGKFVPWDKAKIHILTHTLHYGSGVFEGIRFYNTEKGPAVFKLKEHMARLISSAKVFELKIPYTEKELAKITLKLIKKSELKKGYIRPIVFLGADKIGLNPKGCSVHVAIIVAPFESYLGDKRIKVGISKYRRFDPSETNIKAKACGHYVNSILASMDVRNRGFDEAVLLDRDGKIAEGPGENIFIVKNGKIITPKAKNILPGITRKCVKRIAKDNNIKFLEKIISVNGSKNADEIFLAGTAAEITEVEKIDNKKLPAKNPVTKLIKSTYLDAVHGRIKKYNKWLSYV